MAIQDTSISCATCNTAIKAGQQFVWSGRIVQCMVRRSATSYLAPLLSISLAGLCAAVHSQGKPWCQHPCQPAVDQRHPKGVLGALCLLPPLLPQCLYHGQPIVRHQCTSCLVAMTAHTLPIPCFKHSAAIPQALPARSVALLHCNNPPRAESHSHQRKPSQLKVRCGPASHAPTTLSHEHELQPALPRTALAAAIEGAVRQRVALLSGASSRPDTGIAASFVVREVYTNPQVRVERTTAFIHSCVIIRLIWFDFRRRLSRRLWWYMPRPSPLATRHQPRHTQPSHWHCSRYMVCACASNRKALLTLARYCAFSMLPHQHIEGADVLLMTLFLQEYGPSAGFPLAGSAYLACIDSVQHLTPAAWRTLVYREVLIAYSDHLKSR